MMSFISDALKSFAMGMQKPIILALGKVAFPVALLYPILIGLVYDTHQDAMFIDLHTVTYLGVGDVFCETIICLFVYMLLEFPVYSAIDWMRGRPVLRSLVKNYKDGVLPFELTST